jgi:hypothetical protein
VGDIWVGGGIFAALAWTTWQLGGYRPEVLTGTWLMLGLALGGEVIRRVGEPASPRLSRATWLPVPFLAYAAANVTLVNVKTAPIEVRPIHVTVDVNVRVERALEDFFGDLDQRSETVNLPEPTSP